MKRLDVIRWFMPTKKQQLILFLLIVLPTVAWLPGLFAAQPVTVLFNEVKLNPDVPPVTDGDRVLIPLRAIFEALGARVEWDQETKTITAITRTKFLQLSAGNRKASLNGNKVNLDVPAKIVHGRTMVPVRFVSEALGAQVDWQAEYRRVVIQDNRIHASGQRETFLPEEWPVSYVRIQHEDSPEGFRQDLYRITLDGRKDRLVAENISGKSYTWNPTGDSVALDQDVLVYGAGTANPYATWVKDLASGGETLISYPSGVMGPLVQAAWLDENRLLTSRGTAGPEATAIVVDASSGKILLELPPGFHPLGPRGTGFPGVLRERQNWAEATLALWESGHITRIMATEMAMNFSLDPTGQRVAWLDQSAGKPEENSYVAQQIYQVKIYHLESGQLQAYPLWGHDLSWSPDGNYLVIPWENKLQILEVTSGEIKQLGDFYRYTNFSWRPDGKELVWEKELENEKGGQRVELWHWQATDGQIGPLFIPQHFLAREPVWSPDGAGLLYVAGEKETTRLYLWDVANDTHHPLTSEEAWITVTDPRWISADVKTPIKIMAP